MNKRTNQNFRSGKKYSLRDKYLHISCTIIPKGTQIGVDKDTKLPILLDRAVAAKGTTYVKEAVT